MTREKAQKRVRYAFHNGNLVPRNEIPGLEGEVDRPPLATSPDNQEANDRDVVAQKVEYPKRKTLGINKSTQSRSENVTNDTVSDVPVSDFEV